jgi:hypothetical protein
MRAPLEGAWHGAGPTPDCGLIVHYNRLTLVDHGQSKAFRCEFPHHFRAEEIDLYGPNGVQFGIYSGGDRQIEFELANPGEPRPKGMWPSSVGPKAQWFLFEREP